VAITVAPGALQVLVDYADGFVLQVQACDDVDAALEALRKAALDLTALDGSGHATVSAPVAAPEGPVVRVNGLEVNEDVLPTVADLVSKRLHDAGVSDAVIDVPEPGGDLDGLDTCANAVVLRIFPPPGGGNGAIPSRWVDLASEWVLGDQAPTDEVPLRLLGLEWSVPAADAPSVLHHAAQSRAWCDIVQGNLRERVRTASLTFGGTPHLALAAGGPACDRGALLARFELLCEVARDVAAEAAYLCVDFEPTFEDVGLGLSPEGWQAQGGASPNLVAGRLADLLVPDVFPYQVLGPGHLERFVPGAHLDAPPVGQPLPGDRVEVVVGEAEAWLPLYDGRESVRREGLELLAPLLATRSEVDDLLAGRPDRVTGGPGGDVISGMPDLDDIRLETLPHTRRGLRLTFLELVAWLAHEPHSDAPVTVSPVVATYARWFASALDDPTRQRLKPLAGRLIGTASAAPADGGLPEADRHRAWLATDWLMRVQAARWLRAAGLVEAASRLEAVGPIHHHVELLRAVDIMGSALVIASRRIELNASVAASGHPGDADLVSEASWEAWEAASESAGWVAASEASAVGIPSDLAYATDLRVIECARDPRVRAELDAAGRTIGDTAWATAIRAVADSAWSAAWAAAHRAVDQLAVVPLGTALDRAGRAAYARAEVDDPDLAMERAEAAAVDRLAQVALDTGQRAVGQHPWDAARAAAAAADGGSLWSLVQGLAADAVDRAPWEAGMAAARTAVDEVLRGAPELVARSVGAALAKETASAAARGIAGRATAVARAQGADALTATDAAHDALGPVALDLQDAALAFLEALVEVPSSPAS